MARRPTKRTRPLPRFPGHFTREGQPKRAYRTQSEAAGAAQLAWVTDRAELGTYRCDMCHQWHIGRRFRDN